MISGKIFISVGDFGFGDLNVYKVSLFFEGMRGVIMTRETLKKYHHPFFGGLKNE